MPDPSLSEDVRRALLGAGLRGCFWIWREGDAIRLTIRWADSQAHALRAVRAFAVVSTPAPAEFLVARSRVEPPAQ